MIPVPDLLCADPAVRVDVAALRQTLVFAFAAGGAMDSFDEAVARATLPPSSWGRANFGRDIYLDELLERTLAIRIAGKGFRTCGRYISRVIAEPPRDPRDVDVRRGILSELASSQRMREALESTYLSIVRLRTLLCASRQPAPRVRRVEILRATREAFEILATSFGGATSKLARLGGFGEAVARTDAYLRMIAFLDHDEHMASLELRVRIGADGEVRTMELVGVRENKDSPFYVSALKRLIARLALFLRGYRTTAGEVAERLLSDVFAGVEDHVALLFQLLGDIEPYLASLSFRDRALAQGLAVSLPDFAENGGLRLDGLFNPLLLDAGIAPVTCDVRAAPGGLVLITGPNSGGKTRLLQAIAIAQLFSQAGFFAPVRSASVARASGLFASLFEEARSDQREGHLGMELLRIRRMFDEVEVGALVVIDELCSGTNPSEGEEIARLVLSLLPALGVHAFVTTHLLQFAERLAKDRTIADLDFLQVELDAQERPTYRFVPGVARTSLAHKTAARLGVTRGELLALIAIKKR